MSFTLCPACAAQFQALRFNPNAKCNSALLPFASIVWDDELPPREERHFLYHRECNLSLIRLISLRKQMWKSGDKTEPNQGVWQQAKTAIPLWPGFQRLSLNQEEREALRFCEQETDELMQDFRTSSSVFAVTDEGGGAVRFTAFPKRTDTAS